MSEQIYQKLIDTLTEAAQLLSESTDKYSSLLDKIGDSQITNSLSIRLLSRNGLTPLQ